MVSNRSKALRKARDVRRAQYAANAEEAIGEITPGCEIYGLSRGQFSLIDIIEHILKYTGAAHLTISTWAAAGADVDYTLRLVDDGRVLDMRWVVDSSFLSRQPGYCEALRQAYGMDAIRVTKTHAKFVLIENDEWNIALRTSMNLNENRRLENFEISDDERLTSYLHEVVDEMFEVPPLETMDKAGAVTTERAFLDESGERIAFGGGVSYF